MTRVLFVDDEPHILAGLQRMLRPMRAEWTMDFAPGGIEALNYLRSHDVDVLVTDLRMPGMSGVELLEVVREQFPCVARVILSGQSDLDSTLRLVGLAHQFLSKPCDTETLKLTVLRARSAMSRIRSNDVRSFIANLEGVPSVPALYQEIVSLLQSDSASVQQVAKLVVQDPGMTAKVLQVVNSAFCGQPRQITNVLQAVTIMGFETLRSLLLSSHMISCFSDTSSSGFDINRAWKHAMHVTNLSRHFGTILGYDNKTMETATAAALLHDCGTLVLEHSYPQHCDAVREIIRTQKTSLEDAERIVFRTTHSEVGADLLSLWSMPEEIVNAISHHHTPSQFVGDPSKVLTLVHIADALENVPQSGKCSDTVSLDTDYLESLQLVEVVDAYLANPESVQTLSA